MLIQAKALKVTGLFPAELLFLEEEMGGLDPVSVLVAHEVGCHFNKCSMCWRLVAKLFSTCLGWVSHIVIQDNCKIKKNYPRAASKLKKGRSTTFAEESKP